MTSRWHRAIAGAAAAVAVIGLVVLAIDDRGSSACDRIRSGMEAIRHRSDDSAARAWDDIYTLSEDQAEATRLAREHRRLGCQPMLRGATTTTVAPPTDPRLPPAADLGRTFEDRPSRGSIEGPGRTAYCDFEIPAVPRPVKRVDAWYVSQAALQEAAVEIVDFSDEEDARSAFATIVSDSHCLYEGNQQDGTPVDIAIEDAQLAVTIGYTNTNNSHGVAVAVADRYVVVVWVDVHFGAATADFFPSRDLLALAVGRVVPSSTAGSTSTVSMGGDEDRHRTMFRTMCNGLHTVRSVRT